MHALKRGDSHEDNNAHRREGIRRAVLAAAIPGLRIRDAPGVAIASAIPESEEHVSVCVPAEASVASHADAVLSGAKTRNPKHEIRNKFKIPNGNSQTQRRIL